MPAPIVSIICPVYNVKPYLETLLDSVINQTVQEWLLILIDDGSTDGSGEICDLYARKDPRIRVYHQENCGVSAARNKGLSFVSTDWVAFIDADDEMLPIHLETLLSGVGNGIDLVGASYLRFKEGVFEPESIKKPAGLFNRDAYLMEISKMPNARWFDRYLSIKLFRTDIIRQHHLVFDESLTYKEDALFLFSYVVNIHNSIQVFDTPVYRYFRRSSGLARKTTTHLTERSFDSVFAMAKILDVVREGVSKNQGIYSNLCEEMIGWYFHLCRLREWSVADQGTKNCFREQWDEVDRILRRYLPAKDYLRVLGRRIARSVRSKFKR